MRLLGVLPALGGQGRRSPPCEALGRRSLPTGQQITDPVEITGALGRVRGLPLILRNLPEPVVRIVKALGDEGLDHAVTENGSVGLPRRHLGRDDGFAELPERPREFRGSEGPRILQ
jgi:hypothetical protein